MSRLEERVKNLESRVKRIEDQLELSPAVVSFDWTEFSDRDKAILNFLLGKDRAGGTTTEIAQGLEMSEPETSGRVKVYRRLKRIERVSRKLKGLPIVNYERKKWSLNFDDFQFHVKEESQTKETKKSEEK